MKPFLCLFFFLFSWLSAQKEQAVYQGTLTETSQSGKLTLSFLDPSARSSDRIIGHFRLEWPSTTQEGQIEGEDLAGYAFNFSLLTPSHNYICSGLIKQEVLIGDFTRIPSQNGDFTNFQLIQGKLEARLVPSSATSQPTSQPTSGSTATFTTSGVLEGHPTFVHTLCFSPDGTLLASASTDQTIKLWDPVTGNVLHTFYGHTAPLHSIHFNADGTLLASGGNDGIRIWSIPTKALLKTIDTPESVSCVHFSPDGQFIISSSYGSICFWSINSENRTLLWGSQNANTFTISPDGRYLAAGIYENEKSLVKLWDLRTKEIPLAFFDHELGNETIAFQPDSQGFAMAFWKINSSSVHGIQIKTLTQ